MNTASPLDFPTYRNTGKTRRIIVVGLGSIGRRHTRLLRERPDLKVEVCEPSPQALAAASAEVQGIPVHTDFDKALATAPDLLLIATPHALHEKQAIQGMKAGAHVLCEKPLCTDADEARRMIECSRQTGRQLVVGFQLHFQPGILRARQIIDQGVIGNVLHAHVRVGSFITLRNSLSRYQAKLEGALLLDYAHQPDLLLWLLSDLPSAVTLTGLQGGEMPFSSNPNVVTMTLEYNRPLLATIHLNYVQMPQRHEWEIAGDKGWIVLDPDKGTLRLGLRENESETTETFSTDRDVTYRMEHQAFLDTVDGLRAAESPAEQAARSVELFSMAMESLKRRERVRCQWARY